MAVVLGRALGVGPVACRRGRTKYRVGESLRVVHELRDRDGTAVRVAIRAFPDRGLPAGGDGADLVLAELGALGWVFPNDRKLPSLRPFLTDGERRCQALGRSADRLALVAYAPEKAATVRCANDGRVVGFAKLHAGGADRVIARLHRRIGPQLAAAGLRVPTLLATDPGLGLIMVSPVDGDPIGDRRRPGDWYQLGRAVAALTRCRSTGSWPASSGPRRSGCGRRRGSSPPPAPTVARWSSNCSASS